MPVADETLPYGGGTPAHQSNNNHPNGNTKVDPSDPRVKKLVYSMYRDMLTNYSDDATQFINQKDPSQVTIDYGVLPILQNILKQGSSQSTQSGTGSSESPAPVPPTGPMMAPPPPPPPMAPPGAMPTVRLNSEIGPRDKGPPLALANAMMKDKKPFTYTPGGIDLSEIRSPRMAKRLQMNAAAEGVTSTPESRAAHAAVHKDTTTGPLPPAAMAAMQPQMAISVFPQGVFNPSQLSRTVKPSDFTDGSASASNSHHQPYSNNNKMPPPPPPPTHFMAMHQNTNANQTQKPKSPTPTQTGGIAGAAKSSPPPPPTPPERGSERGSVPMSLDHQNIIESGPSKRTPSTNNAVNEDLVGRVVVTNSSQPPPQHNIGTGSIYIPPISPPTQQQQHHHFHGSPSSSPTPPVDRMSSPRQTKAQAASQNQNLGSIYIPPIEQRPSVFSNNNSNSSINASNSNNSNVSTPGSSGRVASQMSTPTTSTPVTGLSTPQLNKAPTPWMNSYNKMAGKQAESPPYVNPSNVMTPWGTLGAPPPPPPGVHSGSTVRNIPISVARDDDDIRSSMVSPSAVGGGGIGRPPPGVMDQRTNAAQHLGRVIPIQIQRQESQNQQLQQQAWARTIPIQIEGRQQSGLPTSPGVAAPMRRVVVGQPPAGYNNPMGLYSNKNAAEAYQQQTGELLYGMNNMSMGNESPRTEPAQSKSMKVIQKVAENELKKYEQYAQESSYPQYQFGQYHPQQQQQSQQNAQWELMEDDLLRMFKAQVDEGSSPVPAQNTTTEPRFRGGHIPSKAFKALQTTLPSSPSSAVAPDREQKLQKSYPQQSQSGGGGSVTHNIQIRMAPMSPTLQQQQQNLPPSEQKAPEPKKYMGGNIPSRSFKILQAMTAEDDPTVLDVEAAAADYAECDTVVTESASVSSLNSSLSCSGDGSSSGGTSSTDLPSTPSSDYYNWAEPDPNDPYSNYMSWYYYWYYSSCYWAGYDMTGYEYPVGWDPNYPTYYPPEYYGEEYGNVEDVNTAEGGGHYEGIQNGNESSVEVSPPKIVIDKDFNNKSAHEEENNLGMNDCCDSSTEEECYWSCAEEDQQKVMIERQTATVNSANTKGTELKPENNDDDQLGDKGDCKNKLNGDEETDPEDDDCCCETSEKGRKSSGSSVSVEGIVEEPETPTLTCSSSAEDSDAATLVDDLDATNRNPLLVHIEEYNSSESEQDCLVGKNRLSTIDELTENSQLSSPASATPTLNNNNMNNYKSLSADVICENLEEDESEEEEDTSSEDDMSSVSVIENKSDATRFSESKREDGTSSEEENDEDQAETAVTFRLPLRFSFGKTKSYKDITTVLIGDEEVKPEEEPEISFNVQEVSYDVEEISQVSGKYDDCEITGQVEEMPEEKEENLDEEEDDDDDDEPVVSYTISLSRQTSREDKEQKEEEQKHVVKEEKAEDIDFWSQLITPKKPERSSPVNTNTEEHVEFTPIEDFWGTDDDVPEKEASSINSTADTDEKWDKKFNFWDKSVKTIETRRFSNFEISEDYLSDSGMKSDGERETRQRVKRYTHTQKRHSVPSVPGLPVMNRHKFTAAPTIADSEYRKQSTETIVALCESSKSNENQEVDNCKEDTIDLSAGWSYWDDGGHHHQQEERESNLHTPPAVIQLEEDESDVKENLDVEVVDEVEEVEENGDFEVEGEENGDFEVEVEENGDFEVEVEENGDFEVEVEQNGDFEVEVEQNGDFEVEAKEEEVDANDDDVEIEGDVEVVVEIKLPVVQKLSSASEISGNSEDFSDCEEGDEENESEGEEDADEDLKAHIEVQDSDKNAEGSIQTQVQPPVSDENSDESSKSSGTTIGRSDKSEENSEGKSVKKAADISTLIDDKPQLPFKKGSVETKKENVGDDITKKNNNNQKEEQNGTRIGGLTEKGLKIREMGEKIKLSPVSSTEEANTDPHRGGHHHHSHEPSSCTCQMGDRMARAESLLWRIERFLHESLSLGSEDDSGVMTDLSRQISDVDTDADNDLNDTEFLLSAAAAAKERRSNHNSNNLSSSSNLSNKANPTSPLVVRRRPQSEILIETTSKLIEEIDTGGVKMRTTAAERKALRYQRAKTHSRLFQLLQDECGNNEDEVDDDEEDDEENGYESRNHKSNKTPVSFLTESVPTTTTTTIIDNLGTPITEPINVNTDSTSMDNSNISRRSRLMPLPLKNILTYSDSNSSPSGSSGVLSPTSPVTRDQLLADIINEFQMRHQESPGGGRQQRRFSRFPSKIFKVLQQEFGEEFYETFDCSGDDLFSPLTCAGENLLMSAVFPPSNSNKNAQECTIHKSESLKALEEAQSTSAFATKNATANKRDDSNNSSKPSTPDYLEVPVRRKNRDFRTPKTKKC